MEKKHVMFFMATTMVVSQCFSMENQEQEQKMEQAQEKAFFAAVNNGREDIVKKMLKENKTLVNARNERGETPLHCAIGCVSYANINYRIAKRIAARLLRAGADIEAHDHKKRSPLCYAIIYQNLRLVYLLVASGADIDATTDGGYSMFENVVRLWQIRWENPGELPAIALFLLQRGAAKEDGHPLIDPFLENRDLNCLEEQLHGGKRYFRALEVASDATKFPREVNKIIVSLLSKPWAENIEALAQAVPETEIVQAQEKEVRAAAERRAAVVQDEQEQQSAALSLISRGWDALIQADDALQSFINMFRRNRE